MASETFGEWLKRLRAERGETLRSLADKAGVSDTYISLLESGQRAGRRIKVEQIAKALDTDIPDALMRAGFLPNKEDESTDIELTRVLDSQEREVVKYLRGMPDEFRTNAIEGVKQWSEAGERLRAERTNRSIGKAADREENLTVREDSEAGRIEARAEHEARQKRIEEEKPLRDAAKMVHDDPDASLAAAIEAAEALDEKKRQERGFKKR